MATTAHSAIRILFTVGGLNFEAVGFLREGESSVGGDEMLARTAAENGGAIGDKDEAVLAEHQADLPETLRRYWLVTNRRGPGDSRDVSCFDFDDGRWNRDWYWLGRQWFGRFLVVRRCT